MGMSASQCRLLSLTARMSDLEYQAQSISNSKIRLATRSEAAAKDYSDALNKNKLVVQTGVTSGSATYLDATAHLLTTFNAISTTEAQRLLKDSSGKLIVTSAMGDNFDKSKGMGDLNAFLTKSSVIVNPADPNYDSSKVAWYTNIYNEIAQNGYNAPGDDNLKDSAWLYQQFNDGNLFLEKWNATAGNDAKGAFENVSWSSGDNALQTKTDDADLARAEADYGVKTAEIQSQDKKFDLSLQNINTEHTAIQTEVDSVKKVIDKNIERSFKTFNA